MEYDIHPFVGLGEALVALVGQNVPEVAQVAQVRDTRPGRDLSSAEAFAQSLNLPFEELELTQLIGGGGFGQVSYLLSATCIYLYISDLFTAFMHSTAHVIFFLSTVTWISSVRFMQSHSQRFHLLFHRAIYHLAII